MKAGVSETDTFGARSKTHTVTIQIGDTYAEMRDKMLESLYKFKRNGSGWQLKEIVGLYINIAKFDPMEGSGYSDLPSYLKKKKAIINMKNDDEECFRWAITRALNPVDSKPERVTKELKEQSDRYNWKGITFPMKVKNIHIWEINNDININLFGFDEDAKKIYTIRIGQLKDPLNTINLFLHDDNHYCVVKDISRLVSSQLSKNNCGKDICLHCLNAFGRLTKKEKEAGKKSLLEIREEFCSEHKLQHSIYPKEGEFTKFKNVERLHNVPAAFYCDFKGFVEPVSFAANDHQNHLLSNTKTIDRVDFVS